MVVCNSAAFRNYGVECAVESSDIAGPANSNGNDQITLISGDEDDGWFVVDIYGVIGEDGYGKFGDLLFLVLNLQCYQVFLCLAAML